MSYSLKKAELIAQFRDIKNNQTLAVGLDKDTSNLFRDRAETSSRRLNVRSFGEIIKIDLENLTIEAEGMITFEDLTNEALKKGLLPMVVPELKTITLGGGISGLAIESSSFKYGLVHESVLEMDILLANGEVVTAKPDNEHGDLFYAIPNSYGSLGYVIRIKARARKAKQFVRLEHIKFDNIQEFFKQLSLVANAKKYQGKRVDFIDGTAFSQNELYLTLGVDADTAPYTSDYTYKNIYYKSIRERTEDYLTTVDYIWRWDTDWFWCSRAMLLENPLVRRIFGKKRLNSRNYMGLLRLGRRSKIIRLIGRLRPNNPIRESIIQDIEIPIENASEFLEWFNQNIGIKPVWICPTKSTKKTWLYPLYPMDPSKIYINFGFWDAKPTNKDPEKAYYNKLIEKKVSQLGGMKSLYSNSFYSRADFEDIYNYKAYQKLKSKYDPGNYFKDLYQKTVQKP